MSYNEMTDLEINKAVSKYFKSHVFPNIFGEPVRLEPDPAATYTGNDFDEVAFDPCNSWADAGPIIQKCRITLDADLDIWFARDENNVHTDENPLRAAMIVFLMMQEEK